MGIEPIPISLDPSVWNSLPELPNLVARISVLGGDNRPIEVAPQGVGWIHPTGSAGYGPTARVEFTIRNAGEEPAGTFGLRLRLYEEDSGSMLVDRTEQIGGMPPDFDVTLATLIGRTGRYRAELAADAAGQVREQVEWDNAASRSFTVTLVPD